MSDAAEPAAVPPEWDELELAVRRILDEFEQWRRRAVAAEKRVKQLETALQEFATGKVDPARMTSRVEELEREKRELTGRLERARGGVDRIMERLQFVEEAR